MKTRTLSFAILAVYGALVVYTTVSALLGFRYSPFFTPLLTLLATRLNGFEPAPAAWARLPQEARRQYGSSMGLVELRTGSHFGLVYMRERMQQIGGSLTIESKPDCGTVLKLEAPLRVQEDKSQ